MEQRPENRERRERPRRNLLDDAVETVGAMAQVEGPQWMTEQDAVQERLDEDRVSDPVAVEEIAHNTLAGALAHVLELDTPDLAGDPHKVYTIYGRGGLNRWYVYSDGSVKFSESHAQSHEHIGTARQLGFEIIP